MALGPHDGDSHIDAAHKRQLKMPESTVFLAMAPGSVTPSPRMTLMTTMPKARLARASMVL